MLLSMLVVFTSCNNKTDENNNEETQEKQIVVVENAATSYKLVRADKASSMISGLVDRMKASIDSKFGCDMEHATDFVLAGETVASHANLLPLMVIGAGFASLVLFLCMLLTVVRCLRLLLQLKVNSGLAVNR